MSPSSLPPTNSPVLPIPSFHACLLGVQVLSRWGLGGAGQQVTMVNRQGLLVEPGSPMASH